MISPARNAPLACTTCRGSGSVVKYAGSMYTTSDGIEYERPCPDCEGSGVRKCERCGDEDAVGLDSENSATCWPCWHEDRRAGAACTSAAPGSEDSRGDSGPRSQGEGVEPSASRKIRAGFRSGAVAVELAGAAHEDAEPNVKKAVRYLGTSKSVQYEARRWGSPVVRAFMEFLRKSADPLRHVADMRAYAEGFVLAGKCEAQVIALYREALSREKSAEGLDTSSDLCRSTSWQDKALATERDLAADALVAGCERFFAEHSTPSWKVWAQS